MKPTFCVQDSCSVSFAVMGILKECQRIVMLCLPFGHLFTDWCFILTLVWNHHHHHVCTDCCFTVTLICRLLHNSVSCHLPLAWQLHAVPSAVFLTSDLSLLSSLCCNMLFSIHLTHFSGCFWIVLTSVNNECDFCQREVSRNLPHNDWLLLSWLYCVCALY